MKIAKFYTLALSNRFELNLISSNGLTLKLNVLYYSSSEVYIIYMASLLTSFEKAFVFNYSLADSHLLIGTWADYFGSADLFPTFVNWCHVILWL